MKAHVLAAALIALSSVPAMAQEFDAKAELAEVKAMLAVANARECDWALGGPESMREPDVYTFDYRPAFIADDDPPRSFRLYRFFCYQGAYNTGHVYYGATDDELKQLYFATPTFTATYENPETMDGTVTDIQMTGITAQSAMVNSEFDPATLSISDASYWRGIGDASSHGVWVFDDGRFALKTFDLDPSYDGEVNPTRLVDYPIE